MKTVYVVERDGFDLTDYPEFSDQYISKAVWHGTGIALTEEELEDVNDNGEKYKIIGQIGIEQLFNDYSGL